ncbi:MAG TPA: DUF4203 domain-containing protein [Candidatus Limnocylindrales bacterium]|nr:DUF4203 domain-containing protein [Candidatus Limnocylindrales bacterium]
MTEAVIGVLAIVVGLLACLAGYAVFRIVLPILGFVVGMGLGAQLAATIFDQPYLDTPLSWILAIVVGVVVASIAFAWWYISVALTIAGLGYAIGYGAAIGLGLTVTGAVIAGVALAVMFALAAIILRVPIGVVIVVTAFWGSSALLGGVLILLDRIEPRQLRNGTLDVVIAESALLLAVWVALGILGVLVQWFTTARGETTTGPGEPAV